MLLFLVLRLHYFCFLCWYGVDVELLGQWHHGNGQCFIVLVGFVVVVLVVHRTPPSGSPSELAQSPRVGEVSLLADLFG